MPQLRQSLTQARPALELPPVCEARSRSVAVLGGGKPVGTGRFARDAGNSGAFRGSPELDGATLALAAALQQEMQLGKGPATDLLIVGLAATGLCRAQLRDPGQRDVPQLLASTGALGTSSTGWMQPAPTMSSS
jgi:hypothetical protein